MEAGQPREAGCSFIDVVAGAGEVGSSDGIVDRGGRRRSRTNTTMPVTTYPDEDVISIAVLWGSRDGFNWTERV